MGTRPIKQYNEHCKKYSDILIATNLGGLPEIIQNSSVPDAPQTYYPRALEVKLINTEDSGVVEEVDLPVSDFGTNQAASILPLKEENNSFVRNNLIEILFFGLLLFLITSLFLFRKKIPEDSIKKEAEEFEILEK